ncbi:hypothetical protein [Streptomyces zhihengii]
MRLGSVEAVAVEVLRERRAALVADPLAVTIQEVATVNTAENVKAIERQIAGLTVETPAGSGHVSPVRLLRRAGR